METDAEKMKAVNELNCQTYHAKPLKRIYIEKFGKTEKRPLGIPTMRDRAMQALQLLRQSQQRKQLRAGYRLDFANTEAQKMQESMHFEYSAEKIHHSGYLKAILKSCFDKISHEWMMEHIPTDKKDIEGIYEMWIHQ